MMRINRTKLPLVTVALLSCLLVGGCSTLETSSDGPGQAGPTVTDHGAGPVQQAVEEPLPLVPILPKGINAISVPATVVNGSVTVIDTDRPYPEIVMMDPPTPARPGPHPRQQWLGDQVDPQAAPQPGASLAKGLRTTFPGTLFDDNITNTGGYAFIPPDSSGAAGQSHVIGVTNVTVRFHQKTNGSVDLNSSLANFFAAESPLNNTFDPKVIYDQYEDRYVIVTLEKTDVGAGDAADTSRIMLAVSDDGDPNGTWYTTSWNAVQVITNPTWADYPGFAVDDVAIYICVNQFGFSSSGGASEGTRQWVINKGAGSGGFYDGGAVSPIVFDLATSLGMVYGTTQPAHTFGASPFGAGGGTYFVLYSGLSGGGIEYIGVMSLADPFGSPSAGGQYVAIGDIEDFSASIPDAPQPGTATLIETNDRRALHAVWRDDSLWLTTTINPKAGDPGSGEATAYWVELDTTAGIGSLAVASQAAIDGEEIATGTYTYFPAIGVNSAGDVGIGFSASAPTVYAGSYYATRKVDDAPNTLQNAVVLDAGIDYYQRTFGGSQNRWGDYSGLAVDPENQCFWVYNEYAMGRGTGSPPEDGRWATGWGEFCPCSASMVLPDSQWAMVSLPCAPNVTVEQLFGDDGLGVYGTDWAMIERDAVNNSYRQLLATDTVNQGQGYWIKVVGSSPTLRADGGTTDRSADLDVNLAFDADPGRWNMVGHPHTFALNWGNVKVVDNGTSNEYTISDATSANYITNRTMFWWNGSAYQSYHPVTNPGSLSTFMGFWVRVKADASLRFPTSGPKVAQAPALAATGWWLQLQLDAGTATDPGNRLGRLAISTDGADEYDLEEREPHAAPYLTLVFPHPEWGLDWWSCTSDMRALRSGAGGSWDLELRSDTARTVTLSWPAAGGDLAQLLGRSRLIDQENGTVIEPQVGGSYTVAMAGSTHRLTWEINSLPQVTAGPTIPLATSGDAELVPAARFSDEDSGQEHTATIDWGDGTGAQPAVVDGTAGTVTGSHHYDTTGQFTATICVVDSRGGSGCDQVTVEPPLFSDDFESGSTGAWSQTMPGS